MYDRFDQPPGQQLAGLINLYNNVNIDPSLYSFDIPTIIDDSGKTIVNARVGIYGNQQEFQLEYYKLDPSTIPDLSPLAINLVTWVSKQDFFDNIFKRTGFYVDPNHVTIYMMRDDVETLLLDDDIPPLDGVLQIRFSDTHLTYMGHLDVIVRESIQYLDDTIAKMMDTRHFYHSGTADKPPVELYLPNGVLTTETIDSSLSSTLDRLLYETPTGAVGGTVSNLTQVLSILTKDTWVMSDNELPFNLKNATVVYNGFVTGTYNVNDIRFNYVLILQLGALCKNLSGVIRIGYRYSTIKVPSNIVYQQASILPICE